MDVYYSERARVKGVERLLEKLAYASVGLDFIIAAASFLVIRRAAFSALMLTVSGDLIMVEMGVIVVLFVTLMAMRYYGRMVTALEQARFRSKHTRIGAVFGIR